MMPWYVFALVDAPPPGRAGAGLGGALSSRAVPGGFAIVERRADVPPLEFGTLKTHDAVVARIADAVPAILPVRFGTLLEVEEIEEALHEREEEIAEAFALVRGRVQLTWRRAARGAGAGAPSAKAAAALGEARSAKAAAQTGTEYLRRVARAAKPVPPAPFRVVREKLRRLIVAERYEPATASLPDSLYHLVEKSDIARYRRVADGLAHKSPVVTLTGPFAPFAFTPNLL